MWMRGIALHGLRTQKPMRAAKAALFIFGVSRTWCSVAYTGSVDATDQMLVDRAKALFDRIFPGLTARLERIAGGYRPAPPYRVVPPARDRPQVIQLWLHYLAKAL
jgi:hypothetical protein